LSRPGGSGFFICHGLVCRRDGYTFGEQIQLPRLDSVGLGSRPSKGLNDPEAQGAAL
jgi:hypothetical protein